jgi:hypothetical protein
MITSPTHLLGWHSCAEFEFVPDDAERRCARARSDLLLAARGDELALARLRKLPHFRGVGLTFPPCAVNDFEFPEFSGSVVTPPWVPIVLQLFWNLYDSPFATLFAAAAAMQAFDTEQCIILHYGDSRRFRSTHSLEGCYDALDECVKADDTQPGAYCEVCAKVATCLARRIGA